MKLIVASNNAHKVAELDAILSALGFEVCSLKEAGLHVEPEETGETFEENSYIKARATLAASGCATVADDSGHQSGSPCSHNDYMFFLHNDLLPAPSGHIIRE